MPVSPQTFLRFAPGTLQRLPEARQLLEGPLRPELLHQLRERVADRSLDTFDPASVGYLDAVLKQLEPGKPLPPPAFNDPLLQITDRPSFDQQTASFATAAALPPAHARLFLKASYSVEQARRAAELSLSAGHAFMFSKVGLSPDQALTVTQTGAPHPSLMRAVADGASVEEVVRAVEEGTPLELLADLRRLGFTAGQGLTLRHAGVDLGQVPTGATIDEATRAHLLGVLREWHALGEAGASASDGLALLEGGLDEAWQRQCCAWLEAGTVTGAELIAAQAEGLTPSGEEPAKSLLVNYLDAGFSGALAVEAKAAGFGRAYLSLNTRTPYSPAQLVALWGAGASDMDTWGCGKLGLSFDQAMQAAQQGIRSFVVGDFDKLGFSFDETLSIVAAGMGDVKLFEKRFPRAELSHDEVMNLVHAYLDAREALK